MLGCQILVPKRHLITGRIWVASEVNSRQLILFEIGDVVEGVPVVHLQQEPQVIAVFDSGEDDVQLLPCKP